MDTNNDKNRLGQRLQVCNRCDKEKPVYSRNHIDGFICNDCLAGDGEDSNSINEHLELEGIANLIIREGYGEQIRRLEGMIKSPDEKIASGYGGVKQYKDKLGRKLIYMRNRLMEVRPPNFPIKLYRKIRRRYKDNPEKGYKVMWDIHRKHGRKLKEMWGEFNNINEGITTGGLSESPDAIYKVGSFWNGCNRANVKLLMKTMKNMGLNPEGLTIEKYDTYHKKHTGDFTPATELKESPDGINIRGVQSGWDAEDARPFIILNDIAVVRGKTESHGDMLFKLKRFSSDIRNNEIDKASIRYGKKMMIDGKAFYFSKVPTENFFHDFYVKYYIESKGLMSKLLENILSGRIWLESNIISFWNGNSEHNIQLVADALGLDVKDIHPEKVVGGGTGEQDLLKGI